MTFLYQRRSFLKEALWNRPQIKYTVVVITMQHLLLKFLTMATTTIAANAPFSGHLEYCNRHLVSLYSGRASTSLNLSWFGTELLADEPSSHFHLFPQKFPQLPRVIKGQRLRVLRPVQQPGTYIGGQGPPPSAFCHLCGDSNPHTEVAACD